VLKDGHLSLLTNTALKPFITFAVINAINNFLKQLLIVRDDLFYVLLF